MIAVERLTKRYGAKEVLRGVTFRAEPKEITLLVGPNGAGKSTTLKVLAGLIRPTSGLVRVNGCDLLADRIKAQSRLAYLPQSPSFHPRLNCLEVLRFYARLRRVPTARCEAMLELTGLTDVARIRTGKLSGGMRQRLGLALLLLADAPTLLLDEPGLSLDPAWRKRLQETLHFEAERGKTVLVTTHLIAEWNNVADRCLLCRDGAIERELDPSDLLQNFDDSDDAVSSAERPSRRAGEGAAAFTDFSSPHFEACCGEAPQPAGEGARVPGGLR
jgi:Cu-processing system ATP-binding protein